MNVYDNDIDEYWMDEKYNFFLIKIKKCVLIFIFIFINELPNNLSNY